MRKQANNFAFIDAQNITMGIRRLGWELDWYKLMQYVCEKYSTNKVFVFIGYLEKNMQFYNFLRRCGYILIFKPIMNETALPIKGNCDADMVLSIISKIHKYDGALLLTSDGDFYSTVRFLSRHKKLRGVLTPHIDKCSRLLKIEAQGKLDGMEGLKSKIARV